MPYDKLHGTTKIDFTGQVVVVVLLLCNLQLTWAEISFVYIGKYRLNQLIKEAIVLTRAHHRPRLAWACVRNSAVVILTGSAADVENRQQQQGEVKLG